jgi:hypothetical protein
MSFTAVDAYGVPLAVRYPRLANALDNAAYIPHMLRKPLELPPEVAKAFVRDMKLFFKAKGHDAERSPPNRRGC